MPSGFPDTFFCVPSDDERYQKEGPLELRSGFLVVVTLWTFYAAKVIFTRNLVEGFGVPFVEGPVAFSDSSAARGVANRKGVGKLKHLQVRSLWLQTGQSGWTRESRQGRHVAEHCRLGNEVFGRGTTDAVDWNATSARTRGKA